MKKEYPFCTGCEGQENPTKSDHVHQYIGFFGDVVEVIWVDGTCFTWFFDAGCHVAKVLDIKFLDALNYIESLPKKYN